ncbi:MAG TPA: winged helix-turn-helix domain-containing protein [Ktedonobacteraceae bacterium]|nr:winged helix-turn-helix domain-containing protein [Ktedonobacteraceae bacterium]
MPTWKSTERPARCIGQLTALEYELLVLFLRHPRQVLTRDQLLNQIWGYDAET